MKGNSTILNMNIQQPSFMQILGCSQNKGNNVSFSEFKFITLYSTWYAQAWFLTEFFEYCNKLSTKNIHQKHIQHGKGRPL